MNIVVTDGYTLNGGDLSWDKLSIFGKLTVYDRTPGHLIEERCREADIVLTNKVPFDKQTLSKLKRLKLISVLATGYNVIDVAAAGQSGIMVCNAPAYGTNSVAQHVFALLLELTNHAGINARSVSEGNWQNAEDWCYTKVPLTELSGKTFGIIGFGNIGKQAARIAKAFDMNVIYHSKHDKQSDIAEPRLLEELLTESDVVSLHCSLNDSNRQFINRGLLSKMKKTALLINTARGQLINESDLADALNTDVISGAALDVLSEEPPRNGNPLIGAKNCLITPHNAWISREARQRILDITVENISAFLNGKPIHVVS